MPDIGKNKREKIEVCLSSWGPMAAVGYPEDSLQILRDGERLSEETGDKRSQAVFYYQFFQDDLWIRNQAYQMPL